ncbi:hypothetical protein AGLY_013220 [Aphis glycines]|uniref:Uncharacterized protein n=1 Tax=Aphis glycines TaxID=307491 RepID=A0A6G0T700_APHGL|nr:hypothetical protein AGLY_013220 [Aphis glycines]
MYRQQTNASYHVHILSGYFTHLIISFNYSLTLKQTWFFEVVVHLRFLYVHDPRSHEFERQHGDDRKLHKKYAKNVCLLKVKTKYLIFVSMKKKYRIMDTAYPLLGLSIDKSPSSINSERSDECIDFTIVWSSNFYEICRNSENLQIKCTLWPVSTDTLGKNIKGKNPRYQIPIPYFSYYKVVRYIRKEKLIAMYIFLCAELVSHYGAFVKYKMYLSFSVPSLRERRTRMCCLRLTHINILSANRYVLEL